MPPWQLKHTRNIAKFLASPNLCKPQATRRKPQFKRKKIKNPKTNRPCVPCYPRRPVRREELAAAADCFCLGTGVAESIASAAAGPAADPAASAALAGDSVAPARALPLPSLRWRAARASAAISSTWPASAMGTSDLASSSCSSVQVPVSTPRVKPMALRMSRSSWISNGRSKSKRNSLLSVAKKKKGERKAERKKEGGAIEWRVGD